VGPALASAERARQDLVAAAAAEAQRPVSAELARAAAGVQHVIQQLEGLQ
jgi:hypothetical protein